MTSTAQARDRVAESGVCSRLATASKAGCGHHNGCHCKASSRPLRAAHPTPLPTVAPPPPLKGEDAQVIFNGDTSRRAVAFNFDAGSITQQCLGVGGGGAIYVFQVRSTSQDGPALQSIIDGLRAEAIR